MLRCNIALAARGGNSQLSAAGHGGFCEPAVRAIGYVADNPRFLNLARLLLSKGQEILPTE
jgi:hypothetical protein